ncbi:hypothetical protein MMIC_P0513 [Mariprofundus micogutta]|uniref:Lipopolysaccharide-assembly n=1 Tax=Mariprofundus micogutta TaxID=1921010 RepID=A0A1L8CKX5_9PROT|nr:adenosylmethionine-8-amino-7-oxononanoate aminotransferase [Mariprofundus micogutta]GAV19566.1 hypothetical protein MMIC_P0513 [Mariprofundus micogutta]
MRHILLTAVLAMTLLLNGCGYHLVGHGESSGAIPADIKTVTINVSGDKQKALSIFRNRLSSESFALVDSAEVVDADAHAVLHVNIQPVAFVPSAYDAAGVATQYQMTYSGSLFVQRSGQRVWQSGILLQRGDVFVTGGPASIEASKERLLRDLRKQWVNDALGRLRSGF